MVELVVVDDQGASAKAKNVKLKRRDNRFILTILTKAETGMAFTYDVGKFQGFFLNTKQHG